MITNFFTSTRDPESQVTQPKTQKSTKKTRAERIQNSKFKEEWSKIFPAIYFDQEQNAMFCSDCKAAKLTNTFTIGCQTLLKDNIQKHIKSADHKRAIETKTMRSNWDQGVATVHKSHEKDVIATMTSILWMAKTNQPSSNLTDLNDLLDHHVCGDFIILFLYFNK